VSFLLTTRTDDREKAAHYLILANRKAAQRNAMQEAITTMAKRCAYWKHRPTRLRIAGVGYDWFSIRPANFISSIGIVSTTTLSCATNRLP
jgi:hypothetical protein